jgi:hypothetical protein
MLSLTHIGERGCIRKVFTLPTLSDRAVVRPARSQRRGGGLPMLEGEIGDVVTSSHELGTR